MTERPSSPSPSSSTLASACLYPAARSDSQGRFQGTGGEGTSSGYELQLPPSLRCAWVSEERALQRALRSLPNPPGRCLDFPTQCRGWGMQRPGAGSSLGRSLRNDESLDPLPANGTVLNLCPQSPFLQAREW